MDVVDRMKRPLTQALLLLVALGISVFAMGSSWLIARDSQQASGSQGDLDTRVSRFLDQHRSNWRDMNVPESDGRALREIVLKNGYKSALEIGTSTGESGIWIAWALAKTGGRLTTIDIDEGRYRQALKNFQDAGLASFIDARLADAHDLVPKLSGPFDFVFIDADKEWYTNYAKAVIPKVRIGGCITAHNVTAGRGFGRRSGRGMTGDFYSYITSLPAFETTMVTGGGGLSVSYKRRER
jgi:caffeoyl-CoA O-methyltransferase